MTATRTGESGLLRFMKERQPHCANPLDVVAVKCLGGGLENHCFGNARGMCRTGEVVIVSGWLVLPPNKDDGRRQFTQHWWNYSLILGRFFDISPAIEEGAVYLQDMDIAVFAMERRPELRSFVPMSVLYQNALFFGVRPVHGGNELLPLADLATETLFAPYLVRAAA